MLVNLQRLDTHGKPRPWLFVGNRITRCLVCCMVMSLAAVAQESHDFNRGRCQDYLDTYEANGKDPISITEMVMPIVINNFNTRDIYVDETFTINPQTNSVTTSK